MTGMPSEWLRHVVRFVRWYLREITGDAAYERHVARHPGHAPTRREYERHRTAHRDQNPEGRCC
ncbi:YbdD/YjiX family protein [Actinomadura syzygii]|nr:YbdD/YjiX family protein [Actinomadura syzygii]